MPKDSERNITFRDQQEKEALDAAYARGVQRGVDLMGCAAVILVVVFVIIVALLIG